MISERDFITSIREQVIPRNSRLVQGIGDDCAVYKLAHGDPGTFGLISTDTLVEGVHFDLRWHPPDLLGKKAAAVNISDVAAMGGRPTFLLLSVAVPRQTSPAFLHSFMEGFLEQAAQFGTILIGGDTVKSGAEIAFSVTVLGEVDADKVLYRSGAAPGDLIWVSGVLGDAAAGLKICSDSGKFNSSQWPSLVKAHLDPEPAVALGRLLADSGLVTAMIDMSDGLATDLAHICAESSCGATIQAEALPLSEALRDAAGVFGVPPLDFAVSGGEDYTLLFTTSPSAGDALADVISAGGTKPVHCIGEIVAEPGVRLHDKALDTRVEYTGFDHFGT